MDLLHDPSGVTPSRGPGGPPPQHTLPCAAALDHEDHGAELTITGRGLGGWGAPAERGRTAQDSTMEWSCLDLEVALTCFAGAAGGRPDEAVPRYSMSIAKQQQTVLVLRAPIRADKGSSELTRVHQS
jgi:hypothetical protein